jgi:hypothetical protein
MLVVAVLWGQYVFGPIGSAPIRAAAQDAGTTSMKAPCRRRCAGRCWLRASTSRQAATRFGTRLPRICSSGAPTFAGCRSSWGTQMCARRRSARMCCSAAGARCEVPWGLCWGGRPPSRRPSGRRSSFVPGKTGSLFPFFPWAWILPPVGWDCNAMVGLLNRAGGGPLTRI